MNTKTYIEMKELKELLENLLARSLDGNVILAIEAGKIALDPGCELLFLLSTNLKLSGGAVRDYSKKMWNARVLINKMSEKIERNLISEMTLSEQRDVMDQMRTYAETLGELKLIYDMNPDLSSQ